MTPAAAIGLTAAAVATLYGVQIVSGSLGLAASVLANLAVIGLVLGVAHHRGLGLAHLGVRRPRRRFVAAALLFGVSAWYVTMLVVVLIDPPGDTRNLETFVKESPFVPTLLALTIMPALAEELVFRGVLLRALVPRLRAAGAIAVSALVFGGYHILPPQIVSTFVLGLLLGLLTVRARSIVPAMIVHALNNTAAVLLTRDEVPQLGDALVAYPAVTFGAAVACVAWGLVLVVRA